MAGDDMVGEVRVLPPLYSCKVEISPEISIEGRYGCLYMVSMRLEGASIFIRTLLHSPTCPLFPYFTILASRFRVCFVYLDS